jgi:hypothetical protein
MEMELPAGAMVWSLDPLLLQGAQVQETSDGKTSASVPAGGLVFQRRLHLNISWSRDVPCHVYIRVPKPSLALRPKWPLTVEEAKRLHQAGVGKSPILIFLCLMLLGEFSYFPSYRCILDLR